MRCPTCEANAKTAAPPMADQAGGDMEARMSACEAAIAALQDQISGVQMASLSAPLHVPSLV
jgi:hypothetical protein